MEKQSTPQCAVRPHCNHRNAVHTCAIHPLICPSTLTFFNQFVYFPIHRNFHSSLPSTYWPIFFFYFFNSFLNISFLCISLFLSLLSKDAVRCLDYKASMGEWVCSYGGIRGELSYLAPLGSEKFSAPYFKQCSFRGEGGLPPRQSNTAPPSPKTEITNILFYILNFASIIKFKI